MVTASNDPTSVWPVVLGRPTGVWTLTDRRGRWASYDPKTSTWCQVEPGDDPALPALKGLLDSGRTLLGYRVGRRAVVFDGASYAKVVKRSKVEALVERHSQASAAISTAGIGSASVLDWSSDGAILMSAVSGRSLHDVLRCGDEAAVLAAIDTVGNALGEIRDAPTGALTRAKPPDPLEPARIVRPVDAHLSVRISATAATLPRLPDGGTAVLHSDLHDKNVFLDEARVSMIDLDGAATGHAESDVANLATHLHLRALQAGLDDEVGHRRAQTLFASAGVGPQLDADLTRLYQRYVWLRLAGVYRLRAGSRHLVPTLLDRASGRHG